ncbi:RagB/SusD family nutrient uptake outer membrane protein [Hymenobacter rubidus]|uniref:RagB/SusD family nutrient uptake outer membrane protein n=1 Tax=Hymenobacter rubidus TaxID=1441626 RepID=UPI00191D698C|nr:RagB/SusD family nutrient uptake outer membrane protein [Hymenobacter rubidus]
MNAFKLFACAATLGLGTVLATACNEKDLYIPPVANNTADEFYKDESQVNQGVIAIYNGALSFPQSSNWNMSEFRSDNINAQVQTVQRDFSDISNFTATSQLSQLQTTWTDLFEVVYRSNILLEKIQPFSFARVNQFKGEARFLRAYAYFDLVRYWGPLPIVDHVLGIEESKTVPRSPIADVYKLIVDDLKFAADNLPASYSSTDKGRATKWAAKAMLARVYLTMYGYPLRDASALPLAKQQLMDVYAAAGTTTFSMAANFADLFKTVNDNKYAVFEIQYASGGVGLGSTIPWDQGSVFPSWWSPFAPSQTDITPSPDFLGKNWPMRDLRRRATLDTVYVNPTTGAITTTRAQFTKFLEKGTTAPQNNRDYSNNFPIIRFEDVMLMYAEVLTYESNSVQPLALSLVNQIRTRSGIAAYTTTSPETANATAFIDAILKERKYEFAAEGIRWFDLVRTGKAISVMTAYKRLTTPLTARQLDDHDLLFPIPLLELRINPGFWQQNPGYN